jgi:hypothetical protein
MIHEILVYLKDGRVYSVKAKTIAYHKASYFEKNGLSTYDIEYSKALDSKSALTDWLQYKMKWYTCNPKLVKDHYGPLSKAEVKHFSSVE